MCGIAGVAFADRERTPDKSSLKAMADTLRYRGPDAEGIFAGRGIGFAHRRLGIIDLAGGAQPMSDPTGRYTVCFNGEIYNFPALRAELEKAGSHFRTRSDTEVLLEGYRTWGKKLLPRLNGMFAFGLWDEEEQELWLVRDRLGVKPLYWSWQRGGLYFGSTLDSVVAHPGLERVLDHEQFARFVSIGYVPGEPSSLKDIQRLLPGHTLTWRRGGDPVVECWWDLGAIWQERPTDTRGLEEIHEVFLGLLESAVQDRLISDVPLGAFLSGGLDSSTIVALMRRQGALQTFSIGFKEGSYNELPWARRAADALGSEHYEAVLQGSSPVLLEEIAEHLDEPFADTSIIPTYLLCKMAREKVTVALSGDGGDELLAGYVTHIATGLQSKVRRIPSPVLNLARWGAEQLPDSRKKLAWTFKLKQFLRGAGMEDYRAHAWWRMLASPAGIGAMLEGGLEREEAAFEPFHKAFQSVPTLGLLDRCLYVDYRTWLVDDILTKVDRASMAHALEVRSPFLDYRLIEFCAGLPEKLKLKGKKGKILLRQIAEGKVPSEAIHRSKQGFNAPVAQWLSESWSPLFDALLVGRQHPFRVAMIEKLWAEHRSHKKDHGHLLFAVLMGMLWCRKMRPSL